jgi:hypothetical protein
LGTVCVAGLVGVPILGRVVVVPSNPGVHTDAQDRGAPVTPTR